MANNLIISYDLMKQGQDYEAVISKIKSLGNWARLNQSVWYVNSAYSATQARDQLGLVTDQNDKVVVIDATINTWAALNLGKEVVNHLNQNWYN